MTRKWRHAEIADLLGSIVIKSTSGFLEKPSQWFCPACRRSKAQIVAPGRNVDIVAVVHRHHDHIQELIWSLVPAPPRLGDISLFHARKMLIETLERQFCRFSPVDVCHACNAVDPAAKDIIGAPKWFSFSPHGIGSMIKRPIHPYAAKHEIDQGRLSLIWDTVSKEIEGLEDRIRRAIEEEQRATG